VFAHDPAPGGDGAPVLASKVTEAVRQVEVRLEGLADSILHGDRLSGFSGRGLEAAGVREYQEGDEARGIDWRVTARKGRLHVREFEEERDLPFLILLHRSGTLRGGRSGIREIRALEMTSLLAALALREGDRVGVLLGGAGKEAFIPPSRRSRQLLRILGTLLTGPPLSPGAGEGLQRLLRRGSRLARERHRIFLIGDFRLEAGAVPAVRGEMGVLAERHTLTPVWVLDPKEAAFTGGVPLPLEDPREGPGSMWRAGVGGGGLRRAMDEEEGRVGEMFRQLRLDPWRVNVEESLVPRLRTLLVRDRVRGGRRV